MTSLALATPGSSASRKSRHAAATLADQPGLTANRAPAPRAACASAALRTVPAPTIASGTSWAMAEIAASAASVRSVTSRTRMPPAISARAIGTACARCSTTITGITGP